MGEGNFSSEVNKTTQTDALAKSSGVKLEQTKLPEQKTDGNIGKGTLDAAPTNPINLSDKKEEASSLKNEKENNFVKLLENQGLLGEEIKEEYSKIKGDYKQKLINEGKNPKEGETWNELILSEADKNYAEFIKTKVEDRDKMIIDEFQKSSEDNPLPLKYRQEFLNILFKNHYKLYANKDGEIVSMQDYLKDYYKNIGINIEIVFKTIDPEVKKSLAVNLLRDEFMSIRLDKDESYNKAYQYVNSGNEKINYILNDEIAIPHLIVDREDLREEVPLIAGSRDLHMPMRSEKKNEAGERERKGHFIQSQVVHAPNSGCTIQKINSFNIHEIDHAISEVFPTNKEKILLDEELLSEGNAEKANIDFMDSQHQHLKNNKEINNFDGYDFQTNLQKIITRHAVEEPTGKKEQKHRYAQGYAIAQGYENKEGRDKYEKLFYTGELNINEELGDVVKIREAIDEKFIKQKLMYTRIMLGEMDVEK